MEIVLFYILGYFLLGFPMIADALNLSSGFMFAILVVYAIVYVFYLIKNLYNAAYICGIPALAGIIAGLSSFSFFKTMDMSEMIFVLSMFLTSASCLWFVYKEHKREEDKYK